jgi:quinol monooxygenase YgiN
MGPVAEGKPVLVLVEYRVTEAHVSRFVTAVRGLERIRRRDGAFAWGVFRDTDDPELFIEQFVVDSWVEHMRQHERVTMTDRAAEEEVRRLCAAVRVRHLGYADGEERPRA